jgi:hypothetical protein
MTSTSHRIYIGFLSAIVVFSFFAVAYYGFSYYKLEIVDRVYDDGHSLFKPSGVFGHSYGIHDLRNAFIHGQETFQVIVEAGCS